MSKYARYVHHGALVWVNKDLQGKHRELCLCHGCASFKPDQPSKNCPMAQLLFEHCKQFNQVTPVVECPDFQEIGDSEAERLL